MTQDSAVGEQTGPVEAAGRSAPLAVLVSSLLIGALVLVLDQLTKAWILSWLAVGDSVEVLGDFFRLSHTRNTGVAFGLMRDQPFVPYLTALVALGLVVLFAWRLRVHSWPVRIVFGMILGGAIGNLIDRQIHGSVTDFLDFGIGALRWPAFNIADASIVCGVLFLALYFWLQPQEIHEQ